MTRDYFLHQQIHQKLHLILKQLPQNPIFKDLVTGYTLSPAQELAIKVRYLHSPVGIFAQEKYQKLFLDTFVKFFRAEQARNPQAVNNRLLVNKQGKLSAAGNTQSLLLTHLIGEAFSNLAIDHQIGLHSSVNTPEQTNQLRAAARNNELILFRGPSGDYDQFLSLRQVSRGLANRQQSQILQQQLPPKPEVFGQVPTATADQPDNSIIILRQGSQSTTGTIANLEAQIFIRKALAQQAFLTIHGLDLISKIEIDLQKRLVSAQVADLTGQQLLMQSSLIGDQKLFNFTFLNGKHAKKMITVTDEELREYAAKKYSLAQILAEKSAQNALQQAEDAKQQKLRKAAQRIRHSNIDRNNAVTSAALEDQNDQDIQAKIDLANALPDFRVDLQIQRPATPPKTASKSPSAQKVLSTVHLIKESKKTAKRPVRGALRAKNNRQKRIFKLQQQQQLQHGKQRQTKQRQMPAANQYTQSGGDFHQQINAQTKASGHHKWLTIPVIGTSTAIMGGASLFDIFF